SNVSARSLFRSHRSRECRQLSAAHPQPAVADAILVLEQTTRRRPGSARAVLVIRAAVTRAHEEARLREPAHRTSEVRAIHGEHLKSFTVDAPHPAGDLGGRAVPGDADGILIGGQSRLAGRESVYWPQRDPRLSIRASAGGAE